MEINKFMMEVKYSCDGERKLYKTSPNAAGYELFSSTSFEILSSEFKKLPTGVVLKLPDALYAQIAEKSSVSLRGLSVRAGVIDSDYRGQIFVVLQNTSDQKIEWKRECAIAQLIFHSRVNATLIKTNYISEETYRGKRGFGECTELNKQF